MGGPRLVIGKILNHIEPGVTKVMTGIAAIERKEALNAWGARLAAIIEAKQKSSEPEDQQSRLASMAAK